MATKKPKKSTEEKSEAVLTDVAVAPAKVVPATRIGPATPEEFIRALNAAVANVQGLFQLRETLQQDLADLKQALQCGQEMKLERDKLAVCQRELEEFEYAFSVRKERREKELDQLEEERKSHWQQTEEEQKERLKSQVETQTLKLRLEKEDHERRLKLERDDLQRSLNQFEIEQKAFATSQADLEVERARIREQLTQDLNRDYVHAKEVAELHHQREVELLKGEIKAANATIAKLESLVQETREQNEKLAEQMANLSREALASANTAAMAVKLKDLVAQMTTSGAASGPRAN